LISKPRSNTRTRSIRDDVASRIAAKRGQFARFAPQLTIVQAGARPDSSVYVRMKAKAAEEVGIAFRHVTLPAEATAAEVTKVVEDLNGDDTVSGVLVQLPLGEHVGANGERQVTEAISPQKDVDG
jgi:methylenetetrahydrofolate dehydrogenase (NADP+)/methenyltetrahydrofolate cyclohydrolase/formyltetrahydrofolate synthetase